MSRLKSLEPTCVARRAFQLAEKYEHEHGLPEQRAKAAAIGELAIEADDLRKGQIEWTPPQASPSDERASERSWERGGFAGPAGWEGRI